MTAERAKTLREAFIANLREYKEPLNHEFLVEHDVLLDEVYDLCDDVAARLEFADTFIDTFGSRFGKHKE